MIAPISIPLVAAKCDGGCKGCGKAHIKLLGCHDAASQLLRERVEEALTAFPLAHKISEICEPNAIAAAGVTATPALLLGFCNGGKIYHPAKSCGRLPSTRQCR